MVIDSSGMTFNGVKVLGSQSKAVRVNEDGGTTELPAINLQTDPYAAAVVNEISIATLDSAAAALAVVKEGVSQVSIDRAKVGRRKLALKSRASG